MQVDYHSGLYIAQCKFEERHAFSDAGWDWSKDRRAWTTASLDKAKAFQPFATDAAYGAIQDAENKRLGALGLSYAADYPIDIPCPPGLAYDPHQRAGIYYASLRTDTLNADPPGLGKTIMGVGLSNLRPEIRNVLVVCPVHLKINWLREWNKWCVKGLTVGIAGSVTKRERLIDPETGKTQKNPLTGKGMYRTWTEKVWPDAQVVIINYDQLADFGTKIRAMLWDLLIVDESHYLMNEDTERTRQIIGGGKQRKKKTVDGRIVKFWNPAVNPIPADRRLFLTGTPITGKPLNLWPVAKTFDPDGIGKNWFTFVHRYCGAFKMGTRLDVTGASNLEELQVKCRLKFMIRRDKALVMKDLPPMRRQLIELPAEGLAKLVDREISAMRTVRNALADFERMLQGKDDRPDEIDWPGLAAALERRFGQFRDLDYIERFKVLSPPEQVAFQELSTARKELSAAKIPMVVEHLKTWIDAGEKIIVFVVHTEMAEALRDAFPGCGFITGKVSPTKRQAEVDRFQNDPSCLLMVCNFIAGGTGYTMTAASTVVCAELEWSPYLIEQAEARAWRRGQKNAVLSQHLAVEGSTDARLVEVLLEKEAIVHDALDISAIPEKNLLLYLT